MSVYADERVQMLSRIHKEDELVQSAHRIRPMLHPNKTIYLLTNLPIDDLPPTRLVTVNELAQEMPKVESTGQDEPKQLTKTMAQGVYAEIIAKEGHIWLESFKAALRQTFFTSTIDNIT